MTFGKGASAYKAYLESPHGRLRLDILWHQLARFMATAWGPVVAPLQVLDIGCGTGDVALRLAARGHAVTLLDPADEMLHLAKERAQRLTPRPVTAPRFVRGSLDEAPDLLGQETFHLLLCHTVLEYLPSPDSAMKLFGPLLTPGGFLSLVALNGWQEPLRLAVRDGRFEEARKALAEEEPTDSLFGVPRKGIVIDELRGRLEAVGIDVVVHEGIFVFADYLPPEMLEDDPSGLAALLSLEVEAGARSPFTEVARYLHLWGRRAG